MIPIGPSGCWYHEDRVTREHVLLLSRRPFYRIELRATPTLTAAEVPAVPAC
jgi:hypothetical protein